MGNECNMFCSHLRNTTLMETSNEAAYQDLDESNEGRQMYSVTYTYNVDYYIERRFNMNTSSSWPITRAVPLNRRRYLF